jgi:hypothetical protein
MPSSSVCTLFEGDYHYGVGALSNSLYVHGFRGTIYAGYRGPLPQWVTVSKECDGFTEFAPIDGLTLRFIPVDTSVHFATYKADFMLETWQNRCPQAEALYYFDPDITIKCRWTFFEEWAKVGVALCADINHCMHANHPIRYAWKQFCIPHGIECRRDLDIYFNSGFVGVASLDKNFLVLWRTIMRMIGESVGGLDKMILADRSQKFCPLDQDALNIASMVTEAQISPMGQDGMDFQNGGGGYVMSHAVGPSKPWAKRMLSNMLLRGKPPSRADKSFYSFAMHPIPVFSPVSLPARKLDLLLASAIGRYIR